MQYLWNLWLLVAFFCHLLEDAFSQPIQMLHEVLRAAGSQGCVKDIGSDFAQNSTLTPAVQQLECIIDGWLGASPKNATTTVSARGNAQVFMALEDFGGGPLSADDTLAILGSGSGKAATS